MRNKFSDDNIMKSKTVCSKMIESQIVEHIRVEVSTENTWLQIFSSHSPQFAISTFSAIFPVETLTREDTSTSLLNHTQVCKRLNPVSNQQLIDWCHLSY